MEQNFSNINYNSNLSWGNRVLIITQYIFFKTIGLSPWTLDLAQIIKKYPGKNFHYQPISIATSVFGSFHNILLILLVTIYNILVFVHEYSSQVNYSQITVAVGMSLRISGFMTAIFVWISYALRQKIIVQTMRKLINVDRILAKCCYKTNRLTNDNYINLAVLSNFVLMSVGFIVIVKVYPIIIVPIRFVPAVINSWVMIQYSLILNMITNRLKSVNARILKLGNVDTSIKARDILADRSPFSDPKLIAFDLRIIRRACSQLSELSSEVSSFFGFPILIAIIYSGTSTIIYSYFVILSFFEKYSQENIINFSSVSLWFSYMVLSFILMTTNVTRIVLQSKLTADAVHLVLDRCSMDQKIEYQLLEFSRNLLHQKMEFNACGIISLDNSLLFVVSGTIVTYLIILIQFRISNQQV